MASIDLYATGENLRKLMDRANVSAKKLQSIFNFSTPQAIYKWLRGAALPTIDNLVVLADVLGTKVDDILVVIREVE